MFLVFFIIIFLLCYRLLRGVYFRKDSPFECGFQSFGEYSLRFSMPFFLISLMFLVFDIEIILVCLYPLVSVILTFDGLLVFYLVIFLVLVVTLFEWIKGILS